jgi:hypothetical protein
VTVPRFPGRIEAVRFLRKAARVGREVDDGFRTLQKAAGTKGVPTALEEEARCGPRPNAHALG